RTTRIAKRMKTACRPAPKVTLRPNRRATASRRSTLLKAGSYATARRRRGTNVHKSEPDLLRPQSARTVREVRQTRGHASRLRERAVHYHSSELVVRCSGDH